MKKKLIVLSLLLATNVFAENLPVAPPELIKELKAFCQEVADEDGTGDMDLPTFLLDCVNQELEAEGYQRIEELE